MGRKCCVPDCKGGYTKDYKVSVFSFPSNVERRKLWVSKIPRADFEPSSQSVVCEAHFREKFIVRVDSLTRPDGSVLTVERSNPKLTIDAFPSIFPKCPTDLSTESETPVKGNRRKRWKKHTECQQGDDQALSKLLETDKIKDFEEFCSSFNIRVEDNTRMWLCCFHRTSEPFVSLHRVCGDLPASKATLTSTIRVFSDLRVEIFSGKNGKVPDSSVKWLFPQQSSPVLATWSQFGNLISYFASDDSDSDSLETIDTGHEIQQTVDAVTVQVRGVSYDIVMEGVDEENSLTLKEKKIQSPQAESGVSVIESTEQPSPSEPSSLPQPATDSHRPSHKRHKPQPALDSHSEGHNIDIMPQPASNSDNQSHNIHMSQPASNFLSESHNIHIPQPASNFHSESNNIHIPQPASNFHSESNNIHIPQPAQNFYNESHNIHMPRPAPNSDDQSHNIYALQPALNSDGQSHNIHMPQPAPNSHSESHNIQMTQPAPNSDNQSHNIHSPQPTPNSHNQSHNTCIHNQNCERAPQKRRRVDDSLDDATVSAAHYIRLQNPVPEDEHDVFGKNVSYKLRNLQREQRIYAEKVIFDALFEAQLGSLTRSSSVVTEAKTTMPVPLPELPVIPKLEPIDNDNC